MKLTGLKTWLISLASASALTQVVFAQATIGTPVSMNGNRIILVDEKSATPAPANGNGEKKDDEKKDDEKKDDEKKDEEKKDEGPLRLIQGDLCGWKIYGFLYGTGVYNTTNNNNTRYNGPYNWSDQEGAYLNQFYLTVEKAMGEKFAVGGRADFLYGNDYLAAQSRGWELNRNAFITPASEKWNTGQDYGIAIPQLYVEAGTSKASVLVGHCNTPLGYEVIPATGNFFNTHSYTFQYAAPFTHWGVMGKWNPNENWSFTGMVCNGWDSLERQENSASFVGGFKYTSCSKKWSVTFNAIIGDEPDADTRTGVFTGYDTRYAHDLVFDANLSDKVEYVFEHAYGIQSGTGGGDNAGWYSLNNYLFYKLNDCWKVGGRAEWYHDSNGFSVAGFRDGNPNFGGYAGNFYSLGFGANYSPNKNVTIRPELRYDWFTGNDVTGAGRQPFNAGNSSSQFILAIGAIVQF